MAFNKVVISGINTSELTVLKESEKMALLREIRETGSKEAKDKLIKGNLRLVLSVIQRFTGRGEDVDDLRDCSQIKVSRSLRDLAYKAIQAKERLMLKNQCEPTIEQIAQEIGEKRADVVIALESISDPISLYEPVYSDSDDTMYIMDQIGDKNDVESWMDELSIRDAIKQLGERERNILYLRFLKGRTQVEVAREIGISQAQVSRLEKGAISRIKNSVG